MCPLIFKRRKKITVANALCRAFSAVFMAATIHAVANFAILQVVCAQVCVCVCFVAVILLPCRLFSLLSLEAKMLLPLLLSLPAVAFNEWTEGKKEGMQGTRERHTRSKYMSVPKWQLESCLKNKKRLCYLGKAPLLFLPPRVHATLPALASLAFLCRPSSWFMWQMHAPTQKLALALHSTVCQY